MGKHKNILFASAISVLFVLCAICSCGYHDRMHPEETKHFWDGYTKATVLNYTVDGCTWMLELEDGKKVQPLNLKPEFQKNKLRVWIKYEVQKNGIGTCMAGEMVNITEIELRKTK